VIIFKPFFPFQQKFGILEVMSHPMHIYLERPRIHSLLKEAVRKPVTAIIAGAGYGKSHAVYSFAHQFPCRLIWISLTERDNEGDWFWENFCQAVRVVSEESAGALEENGFPSTDRKFNRYLRLPYKETDKRKKYLFVFDDLHTIHNQEVLRFIERSISIPHNNISIILLSRYEVPINLVSVEAKGFLARISQDDLKFSEEEQNAYFELRGLKLSEQMAADVYRSCAGWAFAMRLAGEVLMREQAQNWTMEQQGPEIFRLNLFRLIEKEIISTASPALRRFLIKLSLVFVHHGELAEKIGGASLMDELNHMGAFIDLDTYSGIYRIHTLVLKYLQSLTGELSKAEKKEVYLKAADWCFSKDQKVNAITYYEKAGDYKGIFKTFYTMPLVVKDDVARIMLDIMLKAPRYIYDETPSAYVIRTRLLITLGRFDDAEREIDKAIIKLETRKDITADLDYNRTLEGLYNNRGIMGYFRCHVTGDFSFSDYAEKASQYYMVPGDDAKSYLYVFPVDTYLCRIGCPEKGMIEKYLGALEKFSFYLSQSLTGMSSGLEDAARAEFALYRMDMAQAEELCYTGLKKARERAQYEIENRLLFYLLRIAVYRGDTSAIRTLLEEQESLLKKPYYFNRRVHYDMLTGWFNMQLGKKGKIARWLKSSFEGSDLNSLLNGTESIMKAKYHLLAGEYPQALASLHSRSDGFTLKAFLQGKIITNLLEAVCRYKSGNREKSFAALKTALELAEPEGLYISFTEMGSDMRNLSAAVLEESETGISRELLERIHVSSSAYAKRIARLKKEFSEEGQSGQNSPAAALSPRERKTLAGLYHGLTGEEIARETELSINTVKSVIKRIYNKLGALNKADAIRIALEQGVLEQETKRATERPPKYRKLLLSAKQHH
jgi:LuxR family maltose regulon positive regulatory protein